MSGQEGYERRNYKKNMKERTYRVMGEKGKLRRKVVEMEDMPGNDDGLGGISECARRKTYAKKV